MVRNAKPRHRVTFLNVIGEILLTIAVILLLFVVWQLWWTNVEADNVQAKTSSQIARGFNGPTQSSGDDKDYGDPPPVDWKASNMQRLGVVYIPRFGKDYARPLIEGVGTDVLDTYGVGHYPENAMAGEVGNFAVAGHRQTYGAVFDNVHLLEPGDKIYVQTEQGYYTYVFRNPEITLPTQADVLNPVPAEKNAKPDERIMTLTSCNPRFGSEERIISYAVFDSWRPLDAGPPSGIQEQVSKLQDA